MKPKRPPSRPINPPRAGGAASGPRLQALVAGCSKDERESVTALLRDVLRDRPAGESWTASLVKATNGWSVTLDGPDQRLRGVTFLAKDAELRDVLVATLQRAGFLGGAPIAAPQAGPPAAAAAPQAAAQAGEVRERHTCSECGRPFVVIYMARLDEELETAPVACPNCWQVLQVPVGSEAGATREYRADKVAE